MVVIIKKLFRLLSILGILSLASCINSNDIVNDNHNLSLKYNDVEHYQECDCGHIDGKEYHIYGDIIITKEATCL